MTSSIGDRRIYCPHIYTFSQHYKILNVLPKAFLIFFLVPWTCRMMPLWRLFAVNFVPASMRQIMIERGNFHVVFLLWDLYCWVKFSGEWKFGFSLWRVGAMHYLHTVFTRLAVRNFPLCKLQVWLWLCRAITAVIFDPLSEVAWELGLQVVALYPDGYDANF